jgi:hypothetical protein
MREFLIAAVLAIIASGCAHQMSTATTASDSPKDTQIPETILEPLSIGPVDHPKKGPVPKLQIGMSREEVDDALEKCGMFPSSVTEHSRSSRFRNTTSIWYTGANRELTARFSNRDQLLESYHVTD